MPDVKAFVSYSWVTERATGVVDSLGQLCKERRIELIRDNQVLKHGQLIDQFMDEISKGDHVITVFSKPYFQSTWCMYELLKIYQRGDFVERTHPVFADDCDLQDMDYRLSIVKFWIDQHQTSEKAIEDLPPGLIVEEQKRVNLYRDISQNINKMVNFAAMRSTTPLAILIKEDYAPLLDRIKLISYNQTFDHQISDEDYLKDISLNLELDLKKFEPFYSHVQNNYHTGVGDQQNLTDHLIAHCLSGEFVEVIQALQSAFVDCFDNLAKNEIAEFKKLYDAAYGSVSKLVLFNIKKEWMSQYRESCNGSNGQEYLLPDMSLCGVEIISSRQSGSIPAFKIDKSKRSLQSEKALLLESGIRSTDVVRDVIRALYAKVMGHDLAINMDEDEVVSRLRTIIQQRKRQKNLKLRKNYFLLFPAKGSHSALTDVDVQNRLKQLLPDLAFIRLKSESLTETFIVEDIELTIALEEFFTSLEDRKL